MKKHNLFAMFLAGSVISEPQEDDLALAWDKIVRWAPVQGNQETVDVMVYEYQAYDFEHEGHMLESFSWEPLSPLVDFPQLYPERMNSLPNLRQMEAA